MSSGSDCNNYDIILLVYIIKWLCGGIGRRTGLKIPRSRTVWVQVPPESVTGCRSVGRPLDLGETNYSMKKYFGRYFTKRNAYRIALY